MGEAVVTPEVGTVVEGYIFHGGDPNRKESWQKASERQLKLLGEYQAEAQRPEFGAASESAIENAITGFDRGITRLGQGLATSLGLMDKADYEEARRLDADLMDTKAGTAGNFAGEMIATAPLASPGGKVGAGVLSRALAPRTGAAVGEGALFGAAVSDPGERMQGAALGAAMGGGMTKGGQALKKVFAKGLAKVSRSAEQIMDETGAFIPLAQSGTGLIQTIFRDFIANIPGSTQIAAKQAAKALNVWNDFVHQRAIPKYAGRVFEKTDSPGVVNKKIQEFWESAFNPVRSLDYQLFQRDWRRFAPSHKAAIKAFRLIRKNFANTNGRLDRLQKWMMPERARLKVAGETGKPDMTFSGEDLLDLRIAVKKSAAMTDDITEKTFLESLATRIDDTIKENLNPSGKGKGKIAQIYNEWVETGVPYQAKDALEESPYAYWSLMKKASRANDATLGFTPKELFRAASKKGGSKGLSGEAMGQDIATTGMEAFPPLSQTPNIFQLGAALGIGSGFVPGFAPVAVATGGLMAGARAASTEGFQKALMGRTAAQREIAKLLRENTRYTRPAGKIMRQAVVTGVN